MGMKYIVPMIGASALYAIFFFSHQNGLHDMGLKQVESKTLPGLNDPLRTVYTGVEKIDEILTVLTTFFWTTTDGSHPGLMLHTIGFSGTFGAAWVLVTLESWRRGNAWTIAAFPMVFGLACQVFTFAFATPLYAGFQLASSITASRPNAHNIRVPRAVLKAIPLIFVIGYTVPSMLLIVPAPEMISIDLKQIFIAVWQPWPAYISILTTVVHILFSSFTKNDTSIEGGRATLKSLRRVYAFAFGNAALAHIVLHTISIATVAAPMLFQESFIEALHPCKVFATALPWIPLKVENIADGVHIFLRWDYLIGSTGVLLWAMTLYVNAHKAILGSMCWCDLLTKVGLLTVVSGPVGVAVELMWERDELVIHETGGLKQRVGKEKKSS
ncbi:hypothetical protein PHISCL_02279 [Aspergillus sclerotialis]|uniref:AtmA protein n=1 Tax=Aspergillus sclerotialis TaxID=2070753 RepID=A0A3A2ZQF8_9EURO|nr:hypothetical protein PHISCL_02279 [Aspergillus sclerotialis]